MKTFLVIKDFLSLVKNDIISFSFDDSNVVISSQRLVEYEFDGNENGHWSFVNPYIKGTNLISIQTKQTTIHFTLIIGKLSNIYSKDINPTMRSCKMIQLRNEDYKNKCINDLIDLGIIINML